MSEITMPSLGADMEAATLVEWNIAPGDAIQRGDIIFAVETDKGIIDVEAFEPGVLGEILVQPGTRVSVGTPLATLQAQGTGREQASTTEASTTQAPKTQASKTQTPETQTPETQTTEQPLAAAVPEQIAPATAAIDAKPAATVASGNTETPQPGAAPRHLRASPAARRHARDLNVALDTLSGSGPHGAITVADVEQAAARQAADTTTKAALEPTEQVTEEPAKAAAKEPAKERTKEPATVPQEKSAANKAAMRQAIATAMARSKREIPHYYLSSTIDFTDTLQWLQRYNEQRPVTERVVYAVLLLKAVARALRKVPELDGFWRNDGFVHADETCVGMAISLRGGGLVVPGLRNLAERPLAEVMTEFADVVARARTGRLRSSELTDVSISITSLGEQGVESVFPVIYPPQVAIVGFGSVVERILPVNGAHAIRQVITASLAADHRASDGHRGGIFLAELNRLLQTPEQL